MIGIPDIVGCTGKVLRINVLANIMLHFVATGIFLRTSIAIPKGMAKNCTGIREVV
jgi:hypothetical protein